MISSEDTHEGLYTAELFCAKDSMDIIGGIWLHAFHRTYLIAPWPGLLRPVLVIVSLFDHELWALQLVKNIR